MKPLIFSVVNILCKLIIVQDRRITRISCTRKLELYMINVPNWEQKKERYEQYWNLKNTTPILYITANKDDAKPVVLPDIPEEEKQFNPQYDAMVARAYFEQTYFGGDAYPHVAPTLGNDMLAGLLGLHINYNETSAWVEHSDLPLSEFTDFKIDDDNWHYKKMTEILTTYVEDAKNGDDLDYIVGMVDLSTLYDGVSSLIGPENLCFEMIDTPDEVKRVADEHLEFYKKIYKIYNKIVTKYQGGDTNWLSIYSDIPWYFISNDFMVMISTEFFDEFVTKPLSNMIDFHSRVMFHLDGENAVFHLDKLLTFDKLTGIQVQATPFVQSAEFWIPHIKKIQAAGKTVWIEARHKQDVWELITNLEPQGLFIKTWAETETEAKEIEKMVDDYYKNAGKN